MSYIIVHFLNFSESAQRNISMSYKRLKTHKFKCSERQQLKCFATPEPQ